jgi:hypothetical protein
MQAYCFIGIIYILIKHANEKVMIVKRKGSEMFQSKLTAISLD